MLLSLGKLTFILMKGKRTVLNERIAELSRTNLDNNPDAFEAFLNSLMGHPLTKINI